MKKTKFYALFFLFLVLLTSCAGGTEPKAVFEGSYSLHLAGTWQGEAFEAEILADPLPDGTRQGRVTYTSPAALAGISVTVTGDEMQVACGDWAMAGDNLWGLGLPLWVFLWEYTGFQSGVEGSGCCVYETADEGWRKYTLAEGIPTEVEASLRGLSLQAKISDFQPVIP